MRYLIPLSLLALSCTASVNAEQSASKQWFNTINYAKIDSRYYSDNVYGLSTHYYFEEQQSSGVWDDYGYLDTDSNIRVNYFNSDYTDYLGLFGEGFYKNWFVTGEIYDVDDADDYTLGIGYLFADALKVSVNRDVREYGDDILEALERAESSKPPRPPRVERRKPAVVERYSALHAWRKETAELRAVDSSLVLPKQVLWSIAEQLPTTMTALAQINGMGQWRLDMYGEAILDVIHQMNGSS